MGCLVILEGSSHRRRQTTSASAEIPLLEGLNATKMQRRFFPKNAQYWLKPFVSTSRKTGSANVRSCCFEVAAVRGFAGCVDHSLDWLERLSPGWARGSGAPH